jgi:predicted phage tail protein
MPNNFIRFKVFIRFAILALGWVLTAQALGAGPDATTEDLGVAPNLALINVSQNTVQVRWEPIAEASRYELSYGTDPDASNRGRTFVSGTSQLLANLMSNTIYRVKVRAVTGGRAGAWSTIKEFSTQIPIISGLTADDVRDTSAHLIWSGMFSDLPDTSYEISYGTDQDATSDGLVSTTKNFLTLHNLQPETTYYLKLRGRNAKIVGPWSTPQSIITLAHSALTAPDNLTIASSEHNSVRVTWKALADASNYDFAYGTDPIAESMGIVPVYETRFSVQLAPNTIYYFKVRAVAKGNSGPWSEIQQYLTLPAAPRGLAVAAQNATSAEINWKSLQGGNFARYYHLSWGTDAQAGNLGNTVTTSGDYVLEGLKPDQRYFVRVRTANATGESAWSEPISFSTLPAGLTQLKVLEIHHTSAKIDWSPVPGAQSYEISISTNEDNDKAALSELSQPPAEIKDLKTDQNYYLRIRPLFLGKRFGPWSNLITFATFPVPTVPAGLTVTDIGGTYARVTWTPVEAISTYEVLLSTDEMAEKGRSSIVNRSETQVAGLNENSAYYIKVRAVNLGGPGSWSNPVAIITLPDLSPRNLSVSNLAPTEALLRWESIPGSAAVSYEVRFAREKHVWRTVPNYPGQTFGLEKLDANASYRVQIRAKNQTGYGPWCAEINFRTPPLPPQSAPDDLHAESTTDIAAHVVWKDMAEIDGYLFSRGTDTDGNNQGAEKVDRTEYQLTGLNPETNYFVKVKAYNQTGEGPWSEVVMVPTRPSPPVSAPVGVAVGNVTRLSFTLSWEAADDALSYEVALGSDQRRENAAPISANGTSFTFTDLKPQTTYYTWVRKVNRGGGGPWSQAKTVTTLKPVPTPEK